MSSAREAGRLVGERAATVILVALIIGSITWILLDTVPRFRDIPLSAPPQNTLWDESSRPAGTTFEPGAPVELGVTFRPTVAGVVTGVRFYKAAGNDGPHVGSLWTANGKLLATVMFENESESGWQEARFATPVAVPSQRLLVASYFAPAGGEAVGSESFLGDAQPKPSHSQALRLPTGSNRDQSINVFHKGEPGFPSRDAGDQSFWVDVLFVPELGLE